MEYARLFGLCLLALLPATAAVFAQVPAVAAQAADPSAQTPAAETGAGWDRTRQKTRAEPAAAATMPALDRQPAQTQARRMTRPLARFLSGRSEIDLRHSSATADVSLPLPAAWEPKQLLLRLKYRNSANLLEAHSQLRVELNGLIVAQFRLDPDRPAGEASIRLPVELLETGYNQLRFRVAQHTVIGECEDPLAPELWTQIDAAKSSLTLDYRRRQVARTLAEVDDLIGKYAWSQARIAIAMDLGAERPSRDQLEWGALVAQGAAVRLEYRPLQVALRSLDALGDLAAERELFGLAPDGLILVGTAAQLEPVLGADWAAGVTNSYLGLLPGKPTRPASMERLVVSGRTPAEVRRAAIVLGLLDLPLPDTKEVLIGELALPTLPHNSGQRALLGGAEASFADLGLRTTTLGSPLASTNAFQQAAVDGRAEGERKTSASLDFWVPAGFFPGRHQQGLITLDFSYGAKLRGDSVLNLTLNGSFVRGIPLDNPVGATQLGYQVRFPFNLLVAGRNRLEIRPRMVPSFSDLCQFSQGANLRLTLFDSSRLMLPDVERLVRLPDLRVLSHAGYPLLQDPTGGQFGVQLAGHHPETIAAAWTLLARLAQLVEMPLYRAVIGYEPVAARFATLVVVPVAELDAELRAASPLAIREDRIWIDYPLLALVAPETPRGGWAERGLARLQRWIDPPPGQLQSRDAQVGFARHAPTAALFGRLGGLFEFQSGTNPGKPILMLTASTPALLKARTARLVQPDFWYNLSGGFALWEERDESLRTRPVKEGFTIGQASPFNRANYYLNTYPEALLGIALLLLLTVVSLLFVLTRRFRRRQAAQVFTEE